MSSLSLPSLANVRWHWTKIARIKQKQRARVRSAIRDVPLPMLPLVITITRIGPRKLDDDNLATACKAVRDEVAARMGTDDGSPLYTWRYEQRIGRYAVEIDFNPR